MREDYRQEHLDRHDKQLNQILELIKKVFPEAKRTGNLVQLGSIVFEPIKKRGSDSDKSLIGINVQSNYDWTPFRRVMLKADGSLDAAKLKAVVKDQQEIIKDVFDKHNSKYKANEMKLAEKVLGLYEEYSDEIEKKIGAKGYSWSKGKEKFPTMHTKDGWETTKDSDFDYQLYCAKVIKTSHDDIRSSNEFFMCLFGDTHGQSYEYGAISTKESELYEVMRKWDSQQGVMGKFDKKKATINYVTVYPFEDGR